MPIRSIPIHTSPSAMRRRRTGPLTVATAFLITTAAMSGCKDLSASLPAGTPSPSVFNTAQGAIMKRNAADSVFEKALRQYVIDAGLITDELQDRLTGTSLLIGGGASGSLDERILPQFVGGPDDPSWGSLSYAYLQAVRGSTREAIGALAKYDSTGSPALRGEMYALHGYAEVMLAELFCSGVPLSTYDYGGNFTYKPSSTQQQVYQDAIAKLDTAIALSSDSARILNLARVGLGRAYLDLGDYTSAAAAVASVPDGFRYQVNIQWPVQATGGSANALNALATVSNQEGTNGLPFVSSGDPRTMAVKGTKLPAPLNIQLYFPEKYSAGLDSLSKYYSAITLADGVEARLIAVEAALKAGDPNWLTMLNAIRTSASPGNAPTTTVVDTLGVTHCGGAFPICGGDANNSPYSGTDTSAGKPLNTPFPGAGFVLVAADTTRPAPGSVTNYCYNWSWYSPCYNGVMMVVLTYQKTAWPAGSGGVDGLAPLADPGASAGDTARVNLLFRERASWLYVTGHRQGDLRRLVRNYQRDESTVYPTGPYLAPGQGVYGSDVNAPIPTSENPNPYFHGCLDRNA